MSLGPSVQLSAAGVGPHTWLDLGHLPKVSHQKDPNWVGAEYTKRQIWLAPIVLICKHLNHEQSSEKSGQTMGAWEHSQEAVDIWTQHILGKQG